MTPETMEPWRKVFREGFVPLLDDAQLEVLRDALVKDDEHLLQGATTTPPPMQCVEYWRCEAACLIGYTYAALNNGFSPTNTNAPTVGDTQQYFSRMCCEIDQRIGGNSAIPDLLNPYDEWPRPVMRANLLPEVDREIARRKELQNAPQ